MMNRPLSSPVLRTLIGLGVGILFYALGWWILSSEVVRPEQPVLTSLVFFVYVMPIFALSEPVVSILPYAFGLILPLLWYPAVFALLFFLGGKKQTPAVIAGEVLVFAVCIGLSAYGYFIFE